MNTRTILSEVSQGKDLSHEDFCFLLRQREDYEEILLYANEMNVNLNDDRVSFVHNRNINYTNICIDNCRFCGFRRDLGDNDSYFLSVEEVVTRLAETPEVSEVCIQGGLYP